MCFPYPVYLANWTAKTRSDPNAPTPWNNAWAFHCSLVAIRHISWRHPNNQLSISAIGSHLVHFGTLWAPFRYPVSRSFLLNTQYLSLAGISASVLQVASALSRARQVWLVCLMPSANVAITRSTARSRCRCRLFRGRDIRHGDFLEISTQCSRFPYQRSPPRAGRVGRNGPNIESKSWIWTVFSPRNLLCGTSPRPAILNRILEPVFATRHWLGEFQV